MSDDLAAVVMAGGLGTRMKSATPKHLHPLLGRRMADWVVRAARDAGVERVVVVASPESADSFDGVEVAVQHEPLGTGDAVRSAREALAGATGDVAVLNGDVPALTADSIRTTHRASSTSPTRSACSSATARRSRCTPPRLRGRSRGSTRAPSSHSWPGSSETGSTRLTCSPA